jgi:hypothetical protein
MHFLSPVPVDNKTTQQLKEEVFTIMKNYLLESGKWREPAELL